MPVDPRLEKRARTPRYTFARAGRLVGKNSGTVKRWTSGHSRTYQGTRVIDPALIQMDGSVETLPLSFLNLLELQMLVKYRDDAGLQSIRKALDYAAVQLGVERPLLTVDFRTRGGELFARFSDEHDDSPLVNATRGGQTTLEAAAIEATERIDYDLDTAHRWWVVSRDVPVVVDSRVGAGFPVTADSIVRVDAIQARRDEGLDIDEIAYDTGASTDEVKAALSVVAA